MISVLQTIRLADGTKLGKGQRFRWLNEPVVPHTANHSKGYSSSQEIQAMHCVKCLV